MTSRLPPVRTAFDFSPHMPENAVFMGKVLPPWRRWQAIAPLRLNEMASNSRFSSPCGRVIIHRAAVNAEMGMLFDWAGLTDRTTPLIYETDEECLAIARRESAAGASILANHLSPAGNIDGVNWLNAAALIARFNNKARLDDWAPAAHIPPRTIAPPREAFKAILTQQKPFVLKAATGMTNGGGSAVRICASAEEGEAALASFLETDSDLAEVVIEERQLFKATWCANLAIVETAVHYLGGAMQAMTETFQHTGNFYGAGCAPPQALEDLALEIGEKARAAGYRGIAGMDAGLTEDGRVLVYDLNFRTNACTQQLLLHDSASARIGAATSRGLRAEFSIPLGEVVSKIEDLVKSGRFLPLSAFDYGLYGGEKTQGGALYGVAFGNSMEDCQSLADKLQQLG